MPPVFWLMRASRKRRAFAASALTWARSPRSRHSTTSGPWVKPPCCKRDNTFAKFTLAGARRDLDLFRWTEILYAHAGHHAVHSGGVVHGVEFAAGVIENVSGVVPEAKVPIADPVNNLAAERAAGVRAAVRFQAEADAFGPGVIATLGDDLVVGVGVLLVRPPEQQVRTTARSGIPDYAFEFVGVVGSNWSAHIEMILSARCFASRPMAAASSGVVASEMIKLLLLLVVIRPTYLKPAAAMPSNAT